jgi:predicted metal-dependent enzyme (double-stranded beta helix superfamily)
MRFGKTLIPGLGFYFNGPGEAAMAKAHTTSTRRNTACRKLIRQARAIVDTEGTDDAALESIKALLVKLADKGEALFPRAEFAMPEAQGRNHVLALEDGDGMGLYLTIALPGSEAAPHDHGIWCVNAALSGRELHRFYRRTDDGTRDGYATVEAIGEVLVAPGQGMTMTDHAIHATEVVGDEPAIGLALYGYALTRFPSVVWFHPAFSSVRAGASRRLAEAA